MTITQHRAMRLAVVSTAVWLCAAAHRSVAAQSPLTINYETGTTNSGVSGLTVGQDSAADAETITTNTRSGQYAISHKVTLGDPAYVSAGYPRSESATNLLTSTAGVYYNNTHGLYAFSLSLRDWQSNSNSPDEDIVWQFKHDGTTAVDGRHDIALGVQRNQLWLHWDGNTSRVAVISNVLPLSNEWIDFKFDVLWATDNTGQFTMTMRLPGETTYGHAVTESGYDTFDGTARAGTFGYLKWGVYRNDGNLANGDPATRVVDHDDISAMVVPEPSCLIAVGGIFALIRRQRRRPLTRPFESIPL